jgi:hypothetical protein
MLGVIEMQIKKNPCGQGVNAAVNVVTSEGTPTISSILKTDHRTDMLRPPSDNSRGTLLHIYNNIDYKFLFKIVFILTVYYSCLKML